MGSPHTRGDGPSNSTPAQSLTLFSPHAWGWSAFRRSVGYGARVLPTRVGMVRYGGLLVAPVNGSPHTRGDGPGRDGKPDGSTLFSPHAWGWSVLTDLKSAWEDVLPTRVGMV